MKTISLRFHIELPDFHLDMDTHLPNQGITALFGRSGSGKTTLLRAIAGLERYPGAYCAMGPLIWQDEQKNIFLPPHQRSIAYVFQEASLFDHLTVEQNLAYGWKRVPASQRKISLADIHELLDTQNLLQRKPHHLSGGERQRVAIARALLTSPQLILMDEPLAALDFKRKQEILPCIERLRDKMKIPVIYVSHAADEVARLANHIVVIENGTLTAEGPLSDTLARVDAASVFPDEAGVVLETTVSSHEADGLTRLRFADGELLVSRRHESVGKHLRSRIHARDVSIALEKPGVSSILNAFQAIITAMASTDTPGHVLIRLEMGSTPILALITTRSKNALDLRIGQMVWIQVKAVALLG